MVHRLFYSLAVIRFFKIFRLVVDQHLRDMFDVQQKTHTLGVRAETHAKHRQSLVVDFGQRRAYKNIHHDSIYLQYEYAGYAGYRYGYQKTSKVKSVKQFIFSKLFDTLYRQSTHVPGKASTGLLLQFS